MKLGRGDRLIGLHLLLELCRLCLVEAMLLRDRDTGTTVHRGGTSRDALASEVLRLAAWPLAMSRRPNVVEATVALYDRWHFELEPNYRPDWTGLDAVRARGTGQS